MKKLPFYSLLTSLYLGLTTSAFALTYTLSDLGTLGGSFSKAYGINNSGQLAGLSSKSDGNYRAFLYSNGSMQDLGTLGGSYSQANGINNSGQVVGYAYTPGDANYHAFLYNGTMQDLGALSGTYSQASGINNNGQVLGYFNNLYSAYRGFLYSNGTSQDLGFMADYADYNVLLQVNSINDSGSIVGGSPSTTGYSIDRLYSPTNYNVPASSLADVESKIRADFLSYTYSPTYPYTIDSVTFVNNGYSVFAGYVNYTQGNNGSSSFQYNFSAVDHREAFLYSGSHIQKLGTLGGRESYATSINNSSQVAGVSYTTGNTAQHAFLYNNGNMQDLGTLGGINSYATGINNIGQVVGYSDTTNNDQHVFLYSNGSMTDLNDLLGPVAASSGWVWQPQTISINDNGWISASVTKNGLTHAVLLTPSTSKALSRKDLGESLDYPNACAYTSNPIHIGLGNKFFNLSDYSTQGNYPLGLNRSYNSQSPDDVGLGIGWRLTWVGYGIQSSSSTQAVVNRPDGKGYPFKLVNSVWTPDADVTGKLVKLTNGSTPTGWRYTTADGDVEVYDVNGKLISLTNRAGWVWTLTTVGTTTTVSDPLGRRLVFSLDAQGNQVVTVPSGKTYIYHKDANNNLTTVTYPDSKTLTYAYGETSNVSSSPASGISYLHDLTSIFDENSKHYASYHYDSVGRAYEEEHAPDLGLPVNQKIEHNVLNYSTDTNGNPINTIVTEPTGAQRSYNFTTVLGVVKSKGQNQPAGSGCSAAASNITYDTNGNVATKTDFNGFLTKYGYDLTRNLETSRTEGLNADLSSRPESRTITTSWHATWRLPLTETVYTGATATGTPVKTTTYGYDSRGNLTSLAETDPARSRTRTTTITYTYSTTVPGLVLQKVIDGPRTDISDVTTYVYYPDTATCTASTDYPSVTNLGCRGQLQTMTDALGHVTQYNRYNPNGQLEQMTDANATVSSYTYYPRQWLKTATVDGKTTNFAYDNVGQLLTVTFADGTTLNYTYDDAHRLTDIYDATNHHVHYTLDNSGNRTREQYLNADGSTAKEINRSYDALNRLQTEINGLITQAGSNYGYYANGEAKTSTTPKTNTTNLTVDALGRNTQIIDPVNGSAKPTALGYDPLDRLVQLTAPNGAATSYTLDALDNTLQETSSDTGNTTATYDNAGNVLTRLDSRGITTTYTYDALNRIKTVTTPVVGTLAATTKTYTWDTATGCTHGIGHLCQISYAGITKTFDYDARGNRITETRSQGGTSFTSHFSYNNANRSTGLITPTIETISANLDTAGQVQLLSATSSSSLFTAIAQNISYNANGQVGTQTLGQSTQTQSYDASGRLYTVAGVDTTTTGGGTGGNSSSSGDVPLPPWAMALMGLGLMGMLHRQSKAQARSFMSLLFGFMLSCSLLTGLITPLHAYATDLTIQYDPDGNPSSKTTPSGTTNYTYDALDRLDTEAGATGARNHDFDGNANRTTNGAGTTQTYTANTDRLASVNGVAVTLDAVGNITYDGTYRYVWDAYNQLAELHKADNTLLATYVYDEQGLRLSKVTTSAAPQGASTIFYFYDPQGHLIAETGGASLAQAQTPQMTYVWNGDKLTGVIVHQPSRVVYTVDLDHLGSPFQLRNLAGKVLWRWDTEAFGNTLPNEDVDADGNKLTLNLRFPGQYYDKESGLHYNWHRYYSPKLARYLSPDPIGILGGSNQFSYVGGRPTTSVDPTGKCVGPLAYVCYLGVIYAEELATAAIVGAEIASGVPTPLSSEGTFTGRAAQELTHDVYLGIKNSEPVYAGISKDTVNRACQHGDRFDELKKITPNKVTKDQARAIEQAIISKKPQYQNEINSIAPTRDWYGEAVQWGSQWLSDHGIK